MFRWLPFAVASLSSLGMAGVAPHGRRAFEFDWNLSTEALAFSMAKPDHIAACAVLACLAVWAAGRVRWRCALLLTMLVGLGWELAQSTVVGRGPRLSDLAPDAVGAVLGCLLGAAALWTIEAVPIRAPRLRFFG